MGYSCGAWVPAVAPPWGLGCPGLAGDHPRPSQCVLLEMHTKGKMGCAKPLGWGVRFEDTPSYNAEAVPANVGLTVSGFKMASQLKSATLYVFEKDHHTSNVFYMR